MPEDKPADKTWDEVNSIPMPEAHDALNGEPTPESHVVHEWELTSTTPVEEAPVEEKEADKTVLCLYCLTVSPLGTVNCPSCMCVLSR